jgi:site-specific recombinase XerD
MNSESWDLVQVKSLQSSTPLPSLIEEFMGFAKSANTWRAYRADWKHFAAWCTKNDLVPLPASPETVARYLAENASTLKVATLQRRLTVINRVHQNARHDSPGSRSNIIVSDTWKGIRRSKGAAQTRKVPVLVGDLRRIVRELSSGLIGARDRALLLVGFAGAFRRSELVGLNVDDLDFRDDGLVITLQHSKTDQERVGRKVGLPFGSDPATCPPTALRAWLTASAITSGPVFRGIDRNRQVRSSRLSDKSVGLIVKRAAKMIGKDASQFGGHSLRAGLATSAAMAGASERSIMAQTGHRNASTLRRYIRDGSLFRDNAASKVGL